MANMMSPRPGAQRLLSHVVTPPILKGLAVAALVLLMAGWAPSLAEAVIVNWFGPVWLTRGQSARLSVADTRIPNPNERPCQVQLAFFDAAGDPVGTTDPDQIPAGHSAFLDFERSSTGPAGRVLVRASVEMATQACRRSLIATLEVFDSASGQTVVIIPAAPK